MEIVRRKENFEVKGEIVSIEVSLYHCRECDSEFSTKELGDPYKLAYNEYRRIKGMVQPEEIIDLRKKYDLTQKELSDLLGFGEITLSRYENGSLQDVAHDKILRLAMDSKNLYKLILQNNSFTLKNKSTAVINKIKNEISLCDNLDLLLNSTQHDEFNGFTSLDLHKIAETIKILCYNRTVFKTKLMKLLFYSDFSYFQKTQKSITGLRYAHLPYGPVPDQYELILGAIFQQDSSIQLEPVDFNDYSGEIIRISEPPKISHLTKDEINAINEISLKFDYYSSKAISLSSHKENGYQGTQNSQLISYNFASELKI
jgi:putative zinc finger/helix-turn-helix YgiT family protein